MPLDENKPDYANFEPPAKFQAIESIIAKRLKQYPNAVCSYSGGADSDTMLDLIERVRKIFELPPVRYVFYNTGLEMQCTKDHLVDMEKKYDIHIDRIRPKINVVLAAHRRGIPFISKMFSEAFEEMQHHNLPLDVIDEFNEAQDKYQKIHELYERYPGCRQCLQFLCCCNKDGKPLKCQSTINSVAYLLDFIRENPPAFKISADCCRLCKKSVAHKIEKDYDMVITGERKQEGGIRSTNFRGKNVVGCFSEMAGGRHRLRPLYYVTDTDKAWYKEYYGLQYSDAYEVYKMKRTGCCGCPVSYRATSDLELIRPYEPNLVKAAWNVFGDSYRYRAQYNEYKRKRREEEATKREEAQPKPPLTGEDVIRQADRQG